jgi:hypothetical protein
MRRTGRRGKPARFSSPRRRNGASDAGGIAYRRPSTRNAVTRSGLTFASDWFNELSMNIDELKQAHDLMKQIEATASLLSAYRKAEAIAVAIPQTDAEKRSLRGAAGLPRHDEVTFTAAEIGDQIVSALERRVAMMTEELQKLGVETTPRLREV